MNCSACGHDESMAPRRAASLTTVAVILRELFESRGCSIKVEVTQCEDQWSAYWMVTPMENK